MLPLSLKLKNFICYAEAELDFKGLQLVAIFGANGSGKSTLFSALCWVLWGKSGKERVTDDQLVRSGQLEMKVQLLFQQDNDQYQIIRQRSRRAGGESRLYFARYDTLSNSWLSLSERSIRESQIAINSLIRLDYETFINSAFLLQGRADEFTRKAPSERKAILSEILALGYYEMAETIAKTEAVRLRTEINQLEPQVNQLQQDSQRVVTGKVSLQVDQSTLVMVQQQRHLQLNEFKQLDIKRVIWEQLKNKLETLAEQVVQLRDHQHTLNQTSTTAQTQLAKLAQKEQEIQISQLKLDGQPELNLGQLQAKTDHYQQLIAKQTKLEAAINLASIEKQHQYDLLELQLHDWDSGAGSKLSQQLEHNEVLSQELQNELQELKLEIDQRGIQIAGITANDRHQAALQLVRSVSVESELCPLCQNPLRQEIKEQWQDFDYHSNAELDQRQAELQLLLASIQLKQQALQQLELEHKVLLANLNLWLSLEDNNKALAMAKTKLKQELEFASRPVELTKQWQQLQQDLLDASVDDQQVKRQLQQLQQTTVLQTVHRHLVEELLDQRAASSKLEVISLQLENGDKQLQELLRHQRNQEQVLQELNYTGQQYDQLKIELDRSLARQYELQARIQVSEQEVQRLLELTAPLPELQTNLKDAYYKLQIQEELVAAFGKKGIPATIIESVLPELENLTNLLLTKVSEGRLQVKFVTQRNTKKGNGVIDTLDLEIADSGGYRSYELYSGGEAFRINFAIRIALSTLLARRAGSNLPLLVIDEGFGSQDQQGRELLLQAIRSIQSEFSLIFVITHIREMLGEFDQQLEVISTNDGSYLKRYG